MRPQLVTSLQQGSDVVKTYEPFNAEPSGVQCCDHSGMQAVEKRYATPREEALQAFREPTLHRGWQNRNRQDRHGQRLRTGALPGLVCGISPPTTQKYSCVVVIADTKSGSYYGNAIAALCSARWPTSSTPRPAPHLSRGHLRRRNLCLHPRMAIANPSDALRHFEDPGTHKACTDWVSVETGDVEAKLHPLDVQESKVPDVRGMGLRDTLYL